MLSILIPVYNFNITDLVVTLQEQCRDIGMQFEIRCYDDFSDPVYKKINRAVQPLEAVVYTELPANIGRSKIRNQLAQDAVFPSLLFLDCDSKIVRKDFIRRYEQYSSVSSVVCGGTVYTTALSAGKNTSLHRKFGFKREQMPANKRSVNPYDSFLSNNFLISRELFQVVHFDEQLIQYGHEDTLFGLELKKRSIPVTHIDNPVGHDGLEPFDIFLHKQDKALENLLHIARSNPDFDTKLLSTYRKLKKTGALFLIINFYKIFKKMIIKNLASENPWLRFFDIYKINKFHELKRYSVKHEKI